MNGESPGQGIRIHGSTKAGLTPPRGWRTESIPHNDASELSDRTCHTLLLLSGLFIEMLAQIEQREHQASCGRNGSGDFRVWGSLAMMSLSLERISEV